MIKLLGAIAGTKRCQEVCKLCDMFMHGVPSVKQCVGTGSELWPDD